MEQSYTSLSSEQCEDAYPAVTGPSLYKDASVLSDTANESPDLSDDSCSINSEKGSTVSGTSTPPVSEDRDTPRNEGRLCLWIQEAIGMGFTQTLIAEILSMATFHFESFEELLERLLVLQTAYNSESACPPESMDKRLERLHQENQALRSYLFCKICFDREATVMAIPCGHMCVCVQCRWKMPSPCRQCPVCDEPPKELLLKDSLSSVGMLLPVSENPPTAASLELEAFSLVHENDILRRHRLCQMCNNMDRDQYFLPCNHVVLCKNCSERTTECPACNSHIKERLTVLME